MFDIKTIIKKTLITTLTASFACGLLFTTQNAHATLTQDEINNIKLISSTINTDIDLNVSFDCTKKSLEFCQALYICLIYKNILTTYNDTFKCLSIGQKGGNCVLIKNIPDKFFESVEKKVAENEKDANKRLKFILLNNCISKRKSDFTCDENFIELNRKLVISNKIDQSSNTVVINTHLGKITIK